MSIPQENGGTKPKSIALRVNSSYNNLRTIRLTPKPASITPLPSLGINKPNRSNSAQQQVSLGSGKAKGSVMKRGRYLGTSTGGLRKDLTRRIYRMPNRCWMLSRRTRDDLLRDARTGHDTAPTPWTVVLS